jgi:hypothetical protein
VLRFWLLEVVSRGLVDGPDNDGEIWSRETCLAGVLVDFLVEVLLMDCMWVDVIFFDFCDIKNIDDIRDYYIKFLVLNSRGKIN